MTDPRRSHDDDLRELFGSLRRADSVSPPPFASSSAPRPARPLVRPAIVAVAAVAIVGTVAAWHVARVPMTPPPGRETPMLVAQRAPESEAETRPPVAPIPEVVRETVPAPASAVNLDVPAQGISTGAPEASIVPDEVIFETAVVVANSSPVAAEWHKASTRLTDVLIQDLPVPGRFYQSTLTMAPGAAGDGNVEVHGSRSRDFKAIVGGVASAGPEADVGTESYAPVEASSFARVADTPLSTFAVDVDTASYTNVRRYLESGSVPPRDAVRVEELINYFRYGDIVPDGSDAVGIEVEVADCPWNQDHRLARIAVGARRENRDHLAGSNLVFLLDVSGSMQPPNKLPLVKSALRLLVDGLGDRDTVSIVVYAGASGLALSPTPASDQATILQALERLEAGGSTAGAEGLELAYRTAAEQFVPGGINRVILATDGDFNIGPTSHSDVLDRVASGAQRGVFLTALGFGMGNLKDDRLERLADRGNGHYAYVDSIAEARRLFVEQAGGTLVTVAKDAKIQVEFNPAEVGAYRLIGYENRRLADRDFNDDTKDGGEIGSGHVVTALYELAPPDRVDVAGPAVDPLRYARPPEPTRAAGSGELLTVKVRYKEPEGDRSRLVERVASDDGIPLAAASDDLRFAAAVAAFGLKLRDDSVVAGYDWPAVERLADGARGADEHGHRAEFVDLVGKAGTSFTGPPHD